MARCRGIGNLEIHYKKLNGGSGLDNSIILCRKCLSALLLGSPQVVDTPVFDELVRIQALSRSRYRCECERTDGCHETIKN
jgi:hypothetical protein